MPSLVYPSPRGIAIHPLRDGATTLGRAGDNDLSIDHPTVAEHHAVVIRDGDRLALRDLLSGRTFVNEAPAKGGELRPGDVLRLGEIRMRVAYAAPSSGSNASATTTKTARMTAPEEARPQGLSTRTPGPTSSSALVRPEAAARTEGPSPARETRRTTRALARLRQLSDEVLIEEDLESLLTRTAIGFLEVFDADRGVCLLLEEDGRNPLLTVERRKEGSEEGAGVASEIIEQSLRARTVVRIPPPGGDKRAPGGGFAAPLIMGGKALGLLFFERFARGERAVPFEADDVHYMAIIANQVALAVARILATG